jgi:glycosyltransferase involved in cell wall biosynthesis
MKVFFYPHTYLRDRQIDTIRRWPAEEVINPKLAEGRKGAQVPAYKATAAKLRMSWKQEVPLINIKRRPPTVPENAVVYVWGALMVSGKFIVDLDNPWSLVGYNLGAMPIYRWLIKRLLLSSRCIGIRCMSEACHASMRVLFGEEVYAKAKVHYPCIPQVVPVVEKISGEACRFLFVGTQFEIKGGEALLKAFRRVYARNGHCRLDIVTYLPSKFARLAESCEGIVIHEAHFSRDQIHDLFMREADVLILPTYVESFGMVALEALSHGMALIATDVYALKEMVEQGVNGDLLNAPVSIWNGVVPSAAYHDLANIKHRIRATDTHAFEGQLEEAMERFVADPGWCLRARQASTRLMRKRFSC